MRNTTNDIQFKALADLNNYIQETFLCFEDGFDIIHLLLNFRNSTVDEDERKYVQWELDFFSFDIKGSNIFQYSTSVGASPNVIITYPDFDKFQSEQFEYLKQRILEVKNPVILARYYTLLWKSPKGIKNRKYAIEATKNYFRAIEIHCELAAKTEDYPQYKIGRLFETVVGLCSEVNSEMGELKALKDTLLFDAPALTVSTKHGIIDDMMEYPNIFKPSDFSNVLTIFDEEILVQKGRRDDFALAHYHLPTAVKIAQKTNADVKKWHNEIGRAYLRLAEAESDEDRNWIKINDYVNALESFKLAGNSEKIKEVEQLYFDLKPHVKLQDGQIMFDKEMSQACSDAMEGAKKAAIDLLRSSPEEVYSWIANGCFFPKADEIIKQSRENNFFSSNFCAVIQFDKNKNVAKTAAENKHDEMVYRSYGFHIGFSTLPFLETVFTEGIKTGHLTISNFLGFIAKKSWIGKPYNTIDLSGKQIPIHLMMLLAPAITEYFSHIQAWTSSKFYRPNFVLCIDSLTLKIEAIMRNFCERLNVPTSTSRMKGMQEIYLHDVFDNEIVRKYYNANDMLLFDFLFSNEAYNIRNNVAHGFYLPDEYNHEKMLLLISTLLRIAKLDYNKPVAK